MQDCNSSDLYIQICKGQISVEWVEYQLYKTPMAIFDKHYNQRRCSVFCVKYKTDFGVFLNWWFFIINLYALC